MVRVAKKSTAKKKSKSSGGLEAKPSRMANDELHDVGPRSMIVVRGKTSKAARQLVMDLRQVLAPNTAERLRSSTTTTLKELVQAASVLRVNHLVTVSETTSRTSLRIARLPAGPTITFRIVRFQLAKHVRDEQRRPAGLASAALTSPLLVAHNFAKANSPHSKLCRVTIEAMFPIIDVTTIKLTNCRRVVLCHRVDDDLLELRHYLVRANIAGVSKAVRDIVDAKSSPDLSSLKDIADYVLAHATQIDSDQPSVILPAKYTGRGNAPNRTSSIVLSEIGPRLTLRLEKIQTDVAQGEILFRAH